MRWGSSQVVRMGSTRSRPLPWREAATSLFTYSSRLLRNLQDCFAIQEIRDHGWCCFWSLQNFQDLLLPLSKDMIRGRSSTREYSDIAIDAGMLGQNRRGSLERFLHGCSMWCETNPVMSKRQSIRSVNRSVTFRTQVCFVGSAVPAGSLYAAHITSTRRSSRYRHSSCRSLHTARHAAHLLRLGRHLPICRALVIILLSSLPNNKKQLFPSALPNESCTSASCFQAILFCR